MTNESDNVEETALPNEHPPLEIDNDPPEPTDTATSDTGTEPPVEEGKSIEQLTEQPTDESDEEEAETPRIKRSGTIFFVGVPIGNDGDITLRAIRTLANADVVVCEEAKIGARIMRTHNISAKLMEMNEHNEEEATEEVIALLNAGKTIAVISDAGLPLVADPGAALVQKLRELGLRPTVIPGVSSITTALMVSGFGIDEFDMVGFLPRKIGEREAAARALRHRMRTLVILETPYRLRSLLSILSSAMPSRPAALAMNLTMPNEAVLHDTLAGLHEKFVEKKFRGEFVVVLGPYSGSEEDELEAEMTDQASLSEIEPKATSNTELINKTSWAEETAAGGSRPIRKRNAERFAMGNEDDNNDSELEQEAEDEEQPRHNFNDRSHQDRPRRSFNDRDSNRPRRSSEARNEDRPRRNFNDRRNDDRPRRGFNDRNSEERPRRNFSDRNDERRPFNDRPRRSFDDRNSEERPRRNFNDRNDDRPRRNFSDRNDERRPFNDRPRRSFNDRNSEERPRRNFNDRNEDRPRRNFNDRNEERPRRNFNKGFGAGRPGGGKKFGGKR